LIAVYGNFVTIESNSGKARVIKATRAPDYSIAVIAFNLIKNITLLTINAESSKDYCF
jgi:hypothetical protein